MKFHAIERESTRSDENVSTFAECEEYIGIKLSYTLEKPDMYKGDASLSLSLSLSLDDASPEIRR